MGTFVARELTAERPIADPRVFRNRTYSVGVPLITIVGAVLYGSLVLLPVFCKRSSATLRCRRA